MVNVESAKPKAKAQRNSYNAQIAVDGQAQIIVAATLTQAANDKQQLVPVLAEVKINVGRLPEKVTADSGHFSTAAVTSEALSSVDLYVTPDSGKKTEQVEELTTESPPPTELDLDVTARMREKVKSESGREIYQQRKMIVEPVFGEVKEVRGFRRFSFRGLQKNEAEWSLICLTHNLLKLFRGKSCLEPA